MMIFGTLNHKDENGILKPYEAEVTSVFYCGALGSTSCNEGFFSVPIFEAHNYSCKTGESDVQGESVFYLEGDDAAQDGISQYTLKRTYYKNKSSPDLRKIVSFLVG